MYRIIIVKGGIVIEEKDYTEMLNRLKNGELKNIKIKPDEFVVFQRAFMNFDTRKSIFGKAHQNGEITYFYERGNDNE